MNAPRTQPLRKLGWPGSIGVVAAGAGAAAWWGGPTQLLIFLAASALCLAIFLMWTSLERMGESDHLGFEDALEWAAPSATEEQKLAVLRALKDLEYELTVGKINREDFDLASNEYRAQARRLIAAQDDSMRAQLKAAEDRVQRFLAEPRHDSPNDAASEHATDDQP